ncbi:hypothetical protein [Methylocystis echinoides]|uniref:Uncharacterized protein n=1 Tax=Methylocystis echinoides TaxID=29468 RepID=A0A9W6GYG3_9HYPH|nr:hypothetical protein [Methylocystis echinoides]RTL86012.1 MAG: hypothetical protein EKK29_10895 [Hyphomicrobiales bacterium]GLI95145.1 hypothetical protein LMG27198_41370 [Methylocystis echinoides]
MPMIATYSQAHRRLNHVLEVFFVTCAAGTVSGVVRDDGWVAAVWLAAGLATAGIRASGSRTAASACEKNELADEPAADRDEPSLNERADEQAFESKFLKFTTLLAAAVLACGFALGNLWWGNVLVAVVTWFASMFGIALLCAPRKNGEESRVD